MNFCSVGFQGKHDDTYVLLKTCNMSMMYACMNAFLVCVCAYVCMYYAYEFIRSFVYVCSYHGEYSKEHHATDTRRRGYRFPAVSERNSFIQAA